jgi:predicted ATPase/class 3 adenylate cyclase
VPNLPSGTVTFLFTDIEGSTALWERDRATMQATVERHLHLLREAAEAQGGTLYKTVGDGTQSVFSTAGKAVAAALAAQRSLLAEPWPTPPGPLSVRMALHAGEAAPRDGDYLAAPLNRLARLLASGHGGQILATQAVRQLAREALAPGIAWRDLGAYRLRDLHAPEEVYQLVAPELPDHFPDLRSLPHHPTNLTAPPTALIGREDELAAVMDLVRERGARLVTLTGPGGSGKTRLAVEIAAELLDAFPDGVYFVDLAPVRDPALVLPTVASVLHLREQPAQTPLEALAAFLAPKQMLLVFDNLEQVIGAAEEIAALLTACPRLTVLATSREPLRVRAEREIPIGPLALGADEASSDVDALARSPAVALFVARATASDPAFALTAGNAAAVAAICRRLDGLPLAIELAAARVRLLPPAALLARLERRLPLLTGGARDLPARQQTMRATIAWSHDLLEESERALFDCLAAFAGGFTLEAAEWVADEGGRREAEGGRTGSVLDLLDSLVARNLVFAADDRGGAPRFGMLETIHEFGLERLGASGHEATARERHAAWCLAFAERAGPQANGPDAAEWIEALETEHANLREALTWFRDRGEGTRLMALSVVLLHFWQDRAYYREGRHWLETALELGGEAPAASRMRAMSGAGTMAWYQTDVPRATHWHEQALRLAREEGDRLVEALSLSNLGAQATETGDYARAVADYEASLAVAREAGDPEAEVLALGNLAHVTALRGETPLAVGRFAEALALARKHGESWIEPTILNALGFATADLGDVAGAAAFLREGLELGLARGNAADVIDALEGLARAAAGAGQAQAGARLYGAAAARREAIAMPQSPTEVATHEPIVNRLREALGADGLAAAWAGGRSLSQEEAAAEALALVAVLGAEAPSIAAV